ncbi:hypothetical protein L7F22_066312 [Adiantum nelumboides]|nr:hypothetical protein [Adiantum nelumboides]
MFSPTVSSEDLTKIIEESPSEKLLDVILQECCDVTCLTDAIEIVNPSVDLCLLVENARQFILEDRQNFEGCLQKEIVVYGGREFVYLTNFTLDPVTKGKITRSSNMQPQNMPQSSGLMRYNSAPTSVLMHYLDEADPPGDSSSTFAQAVLEAEFAQFLDDHLICNKASSSPVESVSNNNLPASPGWDSPIPFIQDREGSTSVHHDSEDAKGRLIREGFIPEASHSGSTSNSLLSSTLEHINLIEASTAATSCKPNTFSVQLGERNNIPASHLMGYASSPGHASLSKLLDENAMLLDDPSTPTVQASGDQTAICMASSSSSIPPMLPFDVPAVFCQGITTANRKRSYHGKVVPQVQSVYTAQWPSFGRQDSLRRQNSSPADLISHAHSDVLSSSAHKCVQLSGNSSEEESRIGGRASQGAALNFYTFRSSETSRGGPIIHMPQSSELTSYMSTGGASTSVKVSSSTLKSTEVLCKVSARRGYATDPRSIAERMRRNKINDGIKKLQELVPNTEKFANTVSMLDEAVEYIKYLQRQVQDLSACTPHCTGECRADSSNNIDVDK